MRTIVLAITSVVGLAAASAAAVEPGDIAPPWSAVDFDGRAVKFPELLDGKPAVVIFWATWCPYCKAFMPHLRTIQAEYGTERINVLAINIKEDGTGDPRSYIADLGFPVIAVPDGDAIASNYGIEFVPGLMVIDSDGAVAYQRPSTGLPPGETIASFWARQVRRTLEQLL